MTTSFKKLKLFRLRLINL